jgi:hypothetical protein
MKRKEVLFFASQKTNRNSCGYGNNLAVTTLSINLKTIREINEAISIIIKQTSTITGNKI